MDICVIVASKGEEPPHSFKKIDKTLNKVFSFWVTDKSSKNQSRK